MVLGRQILRLPQFQYVAILTAPTSWLRTFNRACALCTPQGVAQSVLRWKSKPVPLDPVPRFYSKQVCRHHHCMVTVDSSGNCTDEVIQVCTWLGLEVLRTAAITLCLELLLSLLHFSTRWQWQNPVNSNTKLNETKLLTPVRSNSNNTL